MFNSVREMISIWVIIGILFVHWVADFICQSDKMAQNKSSKREWLIYHAFMYTLVFAIALIIFSFFSLVTVLGYLKFVVGVFLLHLITDAITSKIVSKKFKNNHLGGDIPNFGAFTMIGLDQWLHFVQLILVYYLTI